MKAAARGAVKSALDAGEIQRPATCSDCGARERIEAHHVSYEPARWLDVVWLCVPCHRKIHGRRRGDYGEVSSLATLLREARGTLTRIQAAERSGTTRETVRRWEADAVVAPLATLRSYLCALGSDDAMQDAVERAWLARHDRLTTERR